MGATSVIIALPTESSVKILKWKVKEGSLVNVGRVILLYDICANEERKEEKKLKSTEVGTVRKLFAKEGEVVEPGNPLLELEKCTHPTVFKDMCAECGVDLRKDDQHIQNASVPMVHSIPELKVSEEQAMILGKADEERLLKHRKLVLLVDLDQTLIHTTNDNIPANLKDVYHFKLYGAGSPWYHTRLRPGTHKFLTEISRLYELHICTFGARNYAHMIAMFLDQDGKFFSHRILSRDECFNPNSKTANLKALFPCGDNMVCIIDDREDVWNYASNLIHVKPYHFFKHTGDINAPPGLSKQENDDKEGFDFTKLGLDKEPTLEDVKEEYAKQIEKPEETEEIVDAAIDSACSKEIKVDECESCTKLCEPAITIDDSNGDKISNEQSSQPSEELLGQCSDNVKVISEPSEAIAPSDNTDSVIPSNSDCGDCNLDSDADNNSANVSMKVNLNDTRMLSEFDAESIKGDEDLVELEDDDDYLLYLEEILKMIHGAYFQRYDEMSESGEDSDAAMICKVPDMKEMIPEVRSKVLSGTRLVFSGLVPTHVPLEQSRAYLVAVSLGAQVTQDLEPTTTHLVAVRSGTAKVNSARRIQGLKKVTPQWLWSCAERWERADERLFPLGADGAAHRHPPAHCASPEHSSMSSVHGQPGVRRRTPSGRFMDTINPLMTFSSEDIENMDREVEDMFNESDESDGETTTQLADKSVLDEDADASSSSVESLAEGERGPHGWGIKRPASVATGSDSDEEMPSTKFRRGEGLPSDLDLDDLDSAPSNDPPDEVDDGDWNMMGAALEREFLSGNGE